MYQITESELHYGDDNCDNDETADWNKKPRIQRFRRMIMVSEAE